MTLDPELKNDYFLRLTGKGNIPEPLVIGDRYALMAQGVVTSMTESDKNDGTHLITYRFEPVLIETVDDRGKSIKAKDTRSLSSIFRSKVWKYWANRTQLDVDDKMFYERLMSRLIDHAQEICEQYGEDDLLK